MLRRADWFVAPVEPAVGKALIRQWHYAKGGSKTGVYFHGLFHRHVNERMFVSPSAQ